MDYLLDVQDIHTFIGQYHILQGVDVRVQHRALRIAFRHSFAHDFAHRLEVVRVSGAGP